MRAALANGTTAMMSASQERRRGRRTVHVGAHVYQGGGPGQAQEERKSFKINHSVKSCLVCRALGAKDGTRF